jgi:hypothetical protein
MEKTMKPHRHVSMAALQKEIQEGIALQGFAIRHVVSPDEPEFTYTVGLHLPGSTRPELFMSGLSRETRVQWMIHLGFLIQGAPPLETLQRMAVARRVPVESLTFPVGGQVFQPGVRYPDLAGNGLTTCFGEVDKRYYEDYFGQALVFHKTAAFPVLQVVWSDTQGISLLNRLSSGAFKGNSSFFLTHSATFRCEKPREKRTKKLPDRLLTRESIHRKRKRCCI